MNPAARLVERVEHPKLSLDPVHLHVVSKQFRVLDILRQQVPHLSRGFGFIWSDLIIHQALTSIALL